MTSLRSTLRASTAASTVSIAVPAKRSFVGAVPFSSARKWSAAGFADHGWWVFGAAEMILDALESGLAEGLRLARPEEELAKSLQARVDLILDGARKRNERVELPGRPPRDG